MVSKTELFNKWNWDRGNIDWLDYTNEEIAYIIAHDLLPVDFNDSHIYHVPEDAPDTKTSQLAFSKRIISGIRYNAERSERQAEDFSFNQVYYAFLDMWERRTYDELIPEEYWQFPNLKPWDLWTEETEGGRKKKDEDLEDINIVYPHKLIVVVDGENVNGITAMLDQNDQPFRTGTIDNEGVVEFDFSSNIETFRIVKEDGFVIKIFWNGKNYSFPVAGNFAPDYTMNIGVEGMVGEGLEDVEEIPDITESWYNALGWATNQKKQRYKNDPADRIWYNAHRPIRNWGEIIRIKDVEIISGNLYGAILKLHWLWFEDSNQWGLMIPSTRESINIVNPWKDTILVFTYWEVDISETVLGNENLSDEADKEYTGAIEPDSSGNISLPGVRSKILTFYLVNANKEAEQPELINRILGEARWVNPEEEKEYGRSVGEPGSVFGLVVFITIVIVAVALFLVYRNRKGDA